jgi:hypothetical protein
LEQLASSILEGRNWSSLLDLTYNLTSQVFGQEFSKIFIPVPEDQIKIITGLLQQPLLK